MPPLPGQALLIGWLLLPYTAAFLAALLPPLARWLALVCCLATGAVAVAIQIGALPASLSLLGPYGVSLQPDGLAAPFLLLNALVCGAVVLDGWRRTLPGPQPRLRRGRSLIRCGRRRPGSKRPSSRRCSRMPGSASREKKMAEGRGRKPSPVCLRANGRSLSPRRAGSGFRSASIRRC